MSAFPSETYIQRHLTAAKRGDTKSFQKLSSLIPTRQDVFQRILPIIAHYLQPYLPPPSSNFTTSEVDSMALTSLLSLGSGCQRYARDQETIKALAPFFRTQVKDILRWMHYLFKTWLSRNVTIIINEDEPHTHGTTTARDSSQKFDLSEYKANLTACVSCILGTMANHRGVLYAARDDPHLGPLLSQMMLAGARDDYVGLLGSSMRFRTSLRRVLHPSPGPGPDPLEPDALQILLSHSDTYSAALISRLKQYMWQSPLNNKQYLSSIIFTILDGVKGNLTLLDACIEQDGMVCTITKLLFKGVESLCSEVHNNRLQGTPITSDLAIMGCIVQILTVSLQRGGPALICVALEEDLFGSIWAMRTLWDPRDTADASALYKLEELFSSLMEAIIPFIVYPSVYNLTKKFFDRLTPIRKENPKPLMRDTLEVSLKRLAAMLNCETQILHYYIKPAQRYTSAYSNPDKFCDNIECPSLGKPVKLLRCTGCWSGYYCSRECQSIIWARTQDGGHRQECRSIAASIKGRNGLDCLPIHEAEYLRRTVSSRFRYWTKTGLLTSGIPTFDKFIVHMDLTKFPMNVQLYDENDPALDQLPYSGCSVPSIIGRFPVAGKLGKAVGLMAMDVCFEDFLL